MALPPPRPPGPHAERARDRPSLFAVTLRIAIGATLLSFALIVAQATILPGARTPAGPDRDPAAERLPAGPLDPDAVTRPTMPAPRDPRLVPFHGLLDGVTDYDESVAQNQAYAALAEHARRLTDEEARRIVLPATYTSMVREPHLWRGELVRATGLLIRLEPVRLVPGAGPPGLEDAWRGWLMDAAGNEAYLFDFAGPRPEIERRAIAGVEGAFLKVLRYEGQLGHVRDAPFLLARRVWQLADEEVERPFRYDYVVAVLLAGAVILSLVMLKQAGEDRKLMEFRRAKLDEKRERDAKGNGEQPNAGTGAT